MHNLLAGLLLACCCISWAGDIYDEIPAKGKYSYIRRDAIPANKDVFRQYEAATSRKIIYLCIHSSLTYSVRAQWDLTIKNRAVAEGIASADCNEAFAGFMLLGYKAKVEYRY